MTNYEGMAQFPVCRFYVKHDKPPKKEVTGIYRPRPYWRDYGLFLYPRPVCHIMTHSLAPINEVAP